MLFRRRFLLFFKLFTSLCLSNASNYNKSLSLMLSEQIKRKEDDFECQNVGPSVELTVRIHLIDEGANWTRLWGGSSAMSSTGESNRARSASWRCRRLCKVCKVLCAMFAKTDATHARVHANICWKVMVGASTRRWTATVHFKTRHFVKKVPGHAISDA